MTNKNASTVTKSKVTDMTLEELLALPPTVNVVTAARALGIGTHKAYDLIKEGSFPVQPLTLGHTVKIPTAALWKVLGVSPMAR
ncbi:DNA-binding protein [Streptomyces flavofungini]|uniref:DNA-binding protein n=1 Tax=Streptomyces flavofungini TaxID=68200 RepID=UPI0025B01C92|nr:DNA-binding protein [Streptomyces flavofungini]WJV48860.1 DNA-binding protein [Streptomyces flavofungini]